MHPEKVKRLLRGKPTSFGVRFDIHDTQEWLDGDTIFKLETRSRNEKTSAATEVVSRLENKPIVSLLILYLMS